MENRIIIAGSGGQGILFLGKLMTYAAMLEGKDVTWFPAYGAEMRGGTANCTVIISDEVIGSPVIRNPDILMAMNDASYSRFSERLMSNGFLIYDSSLINAETFRKDVNVIPIPASSLAATLKDTKSANMAMLGAFIGVTDILSIESLFRAVDETTPSHKKGSSNINKDLILKGHQLIENKKA